jgi:hypothetical protein
MAAVVGVRGASHMVFKLQIGFGWNLVRKLVINPWWIVGIVSKYSRSASIEKLGLRSDGWMLVV